MNQGGSLKVSILVGLGLVMAVAAGIYAGNRFVTMKKHREMEARAARVRSGEASRLRAGQAFPPIKVLAPGGGVSELPSALAGHPAVLVAISLDCGPCLEEILGWAGSTPLPGPGTIAVVSDDPADEASAFVSRVHLPFPFYTDAGGVLARDWDVTVFPTVIGLDAAGRIAFVRHGIGPDLTPARALGMVDSTSSTAG